MVVHMSEKLSVHKPGILGFLRQIGFMGNWDGTLDRIHHALYLKCREKAAREASPTACIIDSQSVKSAEKGGVPPIYLIRGASRTPTGPPALVMAPSSL